LIKHRVDKGRSKENEVSEISRELKLLAKELDTPIICLSQLSRAVESRGGAKLPQLSDLRDSGSIEQDADIVRFIYRPEYYGISEDENGESTAGKAIIYFAKNRHGATKHITLGFNAELTKFIELEDLKEPKPFTQILPNVDF
jgi:replicative DNA helicase